MAQASSRPVKSFTVVFEGKRVEAYNEQRAARATAQRFGTEHHELTVDITTPDDLLDVMSRFDQPFGNPTAYLTYLIARHTRREVTVALSGAGGDELFAGYPRYRAASLARWALRVPGPVRRATQRALELLPDDRRGGRRHRLRRFLGGLDRDFPTQFVKWTYFLDEADKARLLAGGGAASGILAADRIIRHHLDSSALRDVGNRMLYADVRTFLLDNILEYSDKMTMAVGLEGRVPYLDPRVVEHAMRVPFASKLRGGQGKRILREAFADLLDGPDEGKRGFNAPLGVWVRDVLDPYFDEHMDRQTVRAHGIFDWERIEVLRGQHRRGERDNSYELFAIIVFDVWFRAHLLGTPVGAAR
jgi:asparagine synthase (glutamine-hydrolysing)